MASEEQLIHFRTALAEIHKRWGKEALQPLAASRRAPSRILTGFPALDGLIGGIPVGQVTEIAGAPTSGMSTLALRAVREAQRQGRLAVFVDLPRTFDPGYAAACGVALDQLIIARPEDTPAALDILQVAAVEASGCVVVLHNVIEVLAARHGAALLRSAMRGLTPALRQSGCAALLLTPGDESPTLAGHAALRLRVDHRGWIESHHDITGVYARVTVLKNRRGLVGTAVDVAIRMDALAAEAAA